MSIKSGSNFRYNGPRFLDDRQSIPKNKSQLKTWEVLIPRGFEVFVDHQWYIYDPERGEDEVTGYFHPRLAQGLGSDPNSSISQSAITDTVNSINSSIKELKDNAWPLVLKTLEGGGNYEKGQKVLPTIRWTVGRGGKEGTLFPTKVTIDGSEEGVSSDKLSWSGLGISSTTTYKLHIEADGTSLDHEVTYTFGFQRYWGVSNSTSMTSSLIRDLGNKDWGGGTKLVATFNCSGGKYPWFCIPTLNYNESSFQVWVGGLRMTELVISKVMFTNQFSSSIEYTCIRLGNIQNGSNISIEYK